MIAQAPPQKSADVNFGVNSPSPIYSSSVSDLQFKVFSVLWAIASLFHMAHSSVFDTQLNLALLTLAALTVIIRPSLPAFIILISLQLFDAFFRMPFTTNHWIFTAFVNVTILQVLLFLMIKQRTFNIKPGQFYNTFTPLVKIEVIILYFFAVFHKLNSGFFTPASSCATDLLRAQNIDKIIPLSADFFMVNAYFTLAVELSIPIFLCIRKTRNAAVLLGLFFHCILSYSTYNAFYDFSSMVFAVYFLFLNKGFSLSLKESWLSVKSFINSFFEKFSFKRILYLGLGFFFLLGVIYVLNKKMDTFQSVNLYFFWTVYSILYTGCFLKFMISRQEKKQVSENTFSIPHWSFLVLPFLVFVNGTIPYLGLKTENSYAMFSNLRTEGGKTNHYIVPTGVQVFGFQKEVVEIISSTDPGLQKLANENKALVLFEFRNYVNERKPEKIEYLLNGKSHTFVRTETGALKALGSNPYALRKLMKFRPFTIEEPQPCAH